MSETPVPTASLPEINAGYIPLVDSAVLVATKELGLDKKYGFTLNLHKEVSWANIRDKVNVGIYDCAHMLAPMPIAATLGLGHIREPIIAPFSLNLHGNAITVSVDLFAQMAQLDPENAPAGGMKAALAVAKVVADRKAKGEEPLTFGTVFPFSCHHYELCYWLAAAGINPAKDVRIVVIPPPIIAESLKAGHIQGFCAGAPWPSVSVEEGVGRIVATKTELWRGSPEKVLGVRLAWVEKNQDLHGGLLRALSDAARWLDVAENRPEAAKMLSAPNYLDVPYHIVERPLLGTIIREKGQAQHQDEQFLTFYKDNANFPWRSHALWLLTQMIRWGQLTEPFDIRQAADIIYRPDIYRHALSNTEVQMPISDIKKEGMPESRPESRPESGSHGTGMNFFEGSQFDPADLIGYLRKMDVSDMKVDLDALAKFN